MKGNFTYSKVLPPTWLRFLAIVLLVLGVFFRVVNLDRKVYWFDETFTSLRVAGYTASEANRQICNDQKIGVQDLQKYQRLAPEKTLTDTIKSLAVEDSQHPPLYYVIARFWVQWFGSSVAVTRSVSALLSLLTFPCIYWLCLELFQSPLVGWIAVALLSVTPFHVLYAQEAREYSLWTVTILLSSATLLRAMRVKTKLSWGVYAISVALGLYTFLFSGLVMIAHGVYIVAIESFRLSKKVIAYVLASSVGLLAFTPWLVVVVTNLAQIQNTTSWTDDKIPRLILIKNWAINLSYLFIDFDYDLIRGSEGSWLKLVVKYLIPFILIFVGYSIYFLCRRTPKQVWLFVLTLIGVTALSLVIPDLVFGGVRSQTPRYLIPAYLGIQLAVSYLLATQIIPTSVNIWRRKLWQLIMVMLLTAGVLSCVMSSQAKTWWLKYLNIYTPQMVHIINQANNPVLISSCQTPWTIGDELSLGHQLSSKVQIQLVNESNVPQTSYDYNDVFLYNPPHNPLPQKLRDELEKQHKFKIEKVYFDRLKLWKLVKKEEARR
ncbi:MAG: glycosyltransferase family 39 protein [Iphinoe sp. HA4291-MV1]|nr:glycosyltransferase family 39 protein [Iphinoe sp. HA4291-MV1]